MPQGVRVVAVLVAQGELEEPLPHLLTPSFPSYVSADATVSRAAAEVLAAATDPEADTGAEPALEEAADAAAYVVVTTVVPPRMSKNMRAISRGFGVPYRVDRTAAGELVSLDPATGSPLYPSLDPSGRVESLALGEASVWRADGEAGGITRLT